MEAHVRAPDPLTLSDDMANTWRVWKQDFLIFMQLTGLINDPPDRKANFLKNRVGKVGLDVIEDMVFEQPSDKDDMDILLEKLDAHFDPPKKEIAERYRFFSRSKRNNETIEEYVSDLQKIARACNFEHLTNSIIRDKVVLEIKDYELRKKIFNEDDIDLSTLISIYNDHRFNSRKGGQGSTDNFSEGEGTGATRKPYINKAKPCWKCGVTHPKFECPAWNHICEKCNEKHHFARYCHLVWNKKHEKNKDQKNQVNQTTITPHCSTNLKGNVKSNSTFEKATNLTTGNNANKMNTDTSETSTKTLPILPDVPTKNLTDVQTSNTPRQPIRPTRLVYQPTTTFHYPQQKQHKKKSNEPECVLF